MSTDQPFSEPYCTCIQTRTLNEVLGQRTHCPRCNKPLLPRRNAPIPPIPDDQLSNHSDNIYETIPEDNSLPNSESSRNRAINDPPLHNNIEMNLLEAMARFQNKADEPKFSGLATENLESFI